MKLEFFPQRLDVAAFGEADGLLSGDTPVSEFARLLPELAGDAVGVQVRWEAHGEQRADETGVQVPWLMLKAQAELPLTCQRCLMPVATPLQIEQEFRFVADEDTAEREDEFAEEDVLVVSRDLDLLALIEDELLMALPATPRHEECPSAPPMSVEDADFEQPVEVKKNPFAVLGGLTHRKPE